MRALALPTHSRATLPVLLAAALTVLALWFVFVPGAQAANLRLDGVKTTLTTNPATTTTLFTAGIIPLPVYPTPVVPTADAARYSFPITGGKVDAKTLAGSIRHSGGILLARRNADNTWTALGLTRFTINITKDPFLSAVVNGKDRASIATLDLGSAKISKFTRHGRVFVKVANVAVTLNATATGAINATFHTALPTEVPLGTATVLARVAR